MKRHRPVCTQIRQIASEGTHQYPATSKVSFSMYFIYATKNMTIDRTSAWTEIVATAVVVVVVVVVALVVLVLAVVMLVKLKVKQSRYRPRGAQTVPES